MKTSIFNQIELSNVSDFCKSITVIPILITPDCIVADLNGANILTSNVKKFEKNTGINVNIDVKEMVISFEK